MLFTLLETIESYVLKHCLKDKFILQLSLEKLLVHKTNLYFFKWKKTF